MEVQIQCRDPRKHREEVANALVDFKKRIKKEGIMQELQKREQYYPPSKKRKLKREAANKQRKRDEKKQNNRRDY
jgi:ribosomal protein S21